MKNEEIIMKNEEIIMKNEEIIMKIVDLMYNECVRSGGDGDALWYSRYHKISEILPILKSYNETLRYPFTIEIKESGDIHWGDNQEWIIITNREEEYDNCPSWVQFILRN